MKRKVNQILLFVSVLLSMSIMTRTAYAASSSGPSYISSNWVKLGSGYAMLDVNTQIMYCKNASGVLYRVSDTTGKAVGDADVVYYSEWRPGSAEDRWVINSFDIKKAAVKQICAPYNCAAYLGYYKGYIYYSVGDYTRETLKTYKQNVKTGKRSRIISLNDAGEAYQYKNYMTVMNVRGDPSPTTLRIYNLSTGKVVKTISKCTAVKIIKGMIYYSVYSKSGNTPVQKIYRCNLNGTNAKKIVTYKGSSVMPGIERTYAYFYTALGNVVKYDYSSKKAVPSSSAAWSESWRKGVVY